MLFRRRRDDHDALILAITLSDARIADLKEAHEREVKQLMRLVDMLAEQVEYLRAQMGRPNFARMQGVNPSEQPPRLDDMPSSLAHVSEDEEELRALHEAGHFSDTELEEALAAAGLRNPSIKIDF